MSAWESRPASATSIPLPRSTLETSHRSSSSRAEIAATLMAGAYHAVPARPTLQSRQGLPAQRRLQLSGLRHFLLRLGRLPAAVVDIGEHVVAEWRHFRHRLGLQAAAGQVRCLVETPTIELLPSQVPVAGTELGGLRHALAQLAQVAGPIPAAAEKLSEVEAGAAVVGIGLQLAAVELLGARGVTLRLVDAPEVVEGRAQRSEERRVGKECRCRWSPWYLEQSERR